MEKIIDVLFQLNLNELSKDWTENVWLGNFMECIPLSEDEFLNVIDSGSSFKMFKDLSSLCRNFASLPNNKDENFWQTLVDREIELKPLLAFVYYVIQMGQDAGADFYYQKLSIVASEFYISLIAINGSRAYQVFHPTILQKSIDSLKMCYRLLSAEDNANGQQKTKKKASKRRKAPVSNNQEVMDEDVSNDGLLFPPSSQNSNNGTPVASLALNESQLDDVNVLLCNFLKSLWICLPHVSLQTHQQECALALIDGLVELINLHNADSEQDATLRADDFLSLRSRNVAGLSFAVLHKLVTCQHGDLRDIVKHLIKRLLPVLSMRSADQSVATANAVSVRVVYMKDLSAAFILNLLIDHPDTVGPLVYILIQNLCSKIVDKVAYRSKCASTVVDLCSALPEQSFQNFVQWLSKFARSTKMSYRAFAIDIALALLKKISPLNRPDKENLIRDLVTMIVNRCSDKAASVRMRSLSVISTLITDDKPTYMNLLTSICMLTMPTPNRRSPYNDTPVASTPISSLRLVCARKESASSLRPIRIRPSENVSLVESTQFLPLICRRCSDEKASVRKSALQTLECIALAVPEAIGEQLLDVLHNCCMDPALSVRKQAIETFTNLLIDTDEDENLENKWLLAILPTITDRECSVQDKSSDIFLSAIFRHITSSSSTITDDEIRKAWRLLMKIEQEKEFTRYLLRVMQKLVSRDDSSTYFNARSVKIIEQKAVVAETSSAAWMVLAELSICLTFVPDLAKRRWLDNDLDESIVNYVAKVLANKVDKLNDEECNLLLENMQRRIDGFQISPDHVASVLYAVYRLHQRLFGKKNADAGDNGRFHKWCSSLAISCETYLSHVAYAETATDVDSSSLIRRMMTLGEVVQLSPKTATKRMFYILLAFIVPLDEDRENVDIAIDDQPPALSQPIPSGNQLQTRLDEKIRAYALVVLGKFCLQDEDSAKRCVAALARELATCQSSRIRNNVVVVLADLCVRYTSVVDRHIGTISRCLRDRSQLVRKQSVTLLTTLLKEDYLKWRDILFHRFLTSLLDTDREIRRFTEFCLLNILLPRHPMMFFNHFVECLFVFNDVRHSLWSANGVNSATKEMLTLNVDVINNGDGDNFALNGLEYQDKRLFLYKFMLERFTDHQRFQTSARICQEVLGAVVDEVLPLNDKTESVLSDALIVLSCKEIKLATLNRPPVANGDDADVDDPADQPAGSAEFPEMVRKALSQAVKQSTIENIVPNVVSLKHVLTRKRSPLLKELMIYLRELVNDYKNEVHEIFAADRQLAIEIEYDLKRMAVTVDDQVEDA